jgi:hypothetical protein
MWILKTEIGSLHEDESAAGLPVKAHDAFDATPVSVASQPQRTQQPG